MAKEINLTDIGDHRSVQLKAGAEFFGPFSVVVLDSGTVIVYRL